MLRGIRPGVKGGQCSARRQGSTPTHPKEEPVTTHTHNGEAPNTHTHLLGRGAVDEGHHISLGGGAAKESGSREEGLVHLKAFVLAVTCVLGAPAPGGLKNAPLPVPYVSERVL